MPSNVSSRSVKSRPYSKAQSGEISVTDSTNQTNLRSTGFSLRPGYMDAEDVTEDETVCPTLYVQPIARIAIQTEAAHSLSISTPFCYSWPDLR